MIQLCFKGAKFEDWSLTYNLIHETKHFLISLINESSISGLMFGNGMTVTE